MSGQLRYTPNGVAMRVLFGVILAALTQYCSAQPIIYVDPDAPPGGDGLSWATAVNTIDEGVNRAVRIGEVWVKGGTYVLSDSLFLADTTLRGGFEGNETTPDYPRFGDSTTFTPDPSFDGPLIFDGTLIDSIRITGATSQVIKGARGLTRINIRDITLVDDNGPFIEMAPAQQGETITIDRLIMANIDSTALNGVPVVAIEVDRGGECVITDLQMFDIDFNALGAMEINSFGDHPDERSKLTIDGASMVRNYNASTDFGSTAGALYINARESDIDISNAIINTNRGPTCGGVFLRPTFRTNISIADSRFAGNAPSSINGSGAIWVVSGNEIELDVQRTEFWSNGVGSTATPPGAVTAEEGGAVKLSVRGNHRFEDCEFLDNQAGIGSAIFVENQATLTVRGCDFDGNYGRVLGGFAEGNVIESRSGFFAAITGCDFRNQFDLESIVDFNEGLLANSVIRDNSIASIQSNGNGIIAHCVFENNTGINNNTLYQEDMINCVLDAEPLSNVQASVYPGAPAVNGNIDRDTAGPLFVDPANGDYRPLPNSVLVDSGEIDDIDDLLDLGDLDGDGYFFEYLPIDAAGNARVQDAPGVPGDGPDIGPFELGDLPPDTSGCPADVNMDGQLTPGDFTAWISAYNQGLPSADQNFDGQLTPTDFTAWIANFNTGCS